MTYFAVNGTYSAFAPDFLVEGFVHLRPWWPGQLSGDVTSSGFIPAVVSGRITDGNLTALDGSSLMLRANSGLGLPGNLYYRVEFRNVMGTKYHPTLPNIVVDTESIVLDGFDFLAPTSSSTVDLNVVDTVNR